MTLVKYLFLLLTAFVFANAEECGANESAESISNDIVIGGLECPNQPSDYLVHRRSGGKLDPVVGMEWLQNEARRQNPAAQATLGFAYMRGLGVPLDYAKAREWAALAAEAGSATAHSNLGYLYVKGLGGKKSYLLAYKHYFIAAFTGMPRENFFRGRWHEQEAAARNLPLALLYYSTSAGQGNQEAIMALMKYLPALFVIVLPAALIIWKLVRHSQETANQNRSSMRCLSSRWTFFYKFVLSAFCLVILAGIILLIWLGTLDDYVVREKLFAGTRWVYTLISAGSSLLIGVECLQLKKVTLDLDGFIISNYVRAIKVPLSNIARVGSGHIFKPELIKLEFKEPTAFGWKVVFMPPVRLTFGFTNHPLLEQLQVLIHRLGAAEDINSAED